MPSQHELWSSLLDEPEMWYDKRPTENNRPDFKHKTKGFALWVTQDTPAWAKDKIDVIDDEKYDTGAK